MSRWLRGLSGLFVAALGCVLFVSAAHADPPAQSTNYRLDESTIGAGGLIQSTSSNFQTNSSISDLGIGNSLSSNFQIDAGSVTTDDPALAFAVNGTVSFSPFSPNSASTATTTFTVSNYTSYGYVVQIAGNPPTSGGNTIDAMSSTGASTPGTEQFGINLVANTSPTSFGANPVHGYFASGSASSNYGTSNQYRFVSGETIASASASSGVTTYTISYIVNVTSTTPAGLYTGDQTLVVTGTY